MANRYWIGNTGNWNNTSNWSASSGGSGGASIPSASDNAIFDSNSFSGNSQKCSIDTTATCHDLDMSAVTESGIDLEINNSQSLTISGSLSLSSGVEISGLSNHNLIFSSSAAETITSNGGRIEVKMTFDGTGSWVFQDDLVNSTSSASINLSKGTIDFNDNNITHISYLNLSAGYSARAIYLGNGVITIVSLGSGQGVNASIASGLTINAESSTIHWDNNAGNNTFNGGGFTYNNLVISGSSSQTSQVRGSNTFNNLTIDKSGTGAILFLNGSTQTITGSLTIDGRVSSVSPLKSVTTGSQWSISKSSGTVIAYNISLEDSNAIGGATFQAIDSTDVNNNSGWTFTNTDNSNRSAKITGSLSSSSTISGIITGKQLDNSSRQATIVGKEPESSSRGAVLSGGIIVNSAVSAFITGGDGRYYEDFSTTTYRNANTTASWTGDGDAEMDNG